MAVIKVTSPTLSDANIKSPTEQISFPEHTNNDNTDYKSIISKKMDRYYQGENSGSKLEPIDKIRQRMHSLVTHEYSDMAPHVNGYYFIQMIHGTWKDTILKKTNNDTVGKFDADFLNNNDLSTFEDNRFKSIDESFGQLATDIDIPQINIEYESISGKSRNLNYASKIHYAGDFSINFLENYNNDVFRYHETWFKYIDALKKGYVNPPKSSLENQDTNTFIDVPYFNAVWVVIFAPFSTNIRGLIKIMGVSPVNLPFKQIIGDRGKNALTTINQNYKSNDMLYKFFEDEVDQQNSAFFKDFEADMKIAWSL